ncbi:MAG: beta-lactamase family protein [Proteobacteria bacterium]|nr:beta-lactamase family protein [Pseudomonadota bacterium]
MNKTFIHFIAIGLSALSLQLARPAIAESLPEQTRTRLAATVAEFYERAGPPAVTVLVDRKGETVFEFSIGLADIAEQRAPGSDSVFAIGSITKSFTALATLQLVDAGKVSLDDTVGKWLPDYAGPARDVTVSHLLDHTSGIPNYTEIAPLYPKLERNAWMRDEMVANFAPLPLQFEPGTRWSYTNSGYYLLGLIIERASGLDYYEYLGRNVFAPLGMTRSFSGNDAEIVPGRVRGYRVRNGVTNNASPWHYLVPFSAGSLLSTAKDLARYRRGVFTSPQFSPSLRALVTRTVPLQDGTANLYALGGLIDSEFGGHRKLSHSGEIFGFHSDHAYYPAEDLTIVVLTNRAGLMPSPVSLERKLARILLDVQAPDTLPVAIKPVELERYAGDFDLRPFLFGPERYTFAIENGSLVVKIGGAEAPGLPLVPVGRHRFAMALDDEWTFDFDVPQRGPASGFTMHVADGRLTGYRATH